MRQLKKNAVVASTKQQNEEDDPTYKDVNPFEQLRRRGDQISANTSSVVHAYETLRTNVERNFNLHTEMAEHFDDVSLQEEDAEVRHDAGAQAQIESNEKQETSLNSVILSLKKARHDKQHLYRISPPATTPHLRIFPATLPSISHSVHGNAEISLNLSRYVFFCLFFVFVYFCVLFL